MSTTTLPLTRQDGVGLTRHPSAPLPTVIQGGMGVSVSSWQLARAVSLTGQLGVVSGTAIDVVIARRLQDGDLDGHVRRALAAFPVPAMARRVLRSWYVHGGRARDHSYAAVPRYTVTPSTALAELTVVAAFCEVWLAKEGHPGVVGVNLLRKIDMPIPFVLLGALLADVDYVLVGAGNPAEIPGLVRGLAAGRDVDLPLRVQGLRSDDEPVAVRCSPAALLAERPEVLGRLHVPRVLAIVASTDLATGLAADPSTKPFGFVVEGPSAGGHNAPPRGPRRLDERGEPVYDERDRPDLATLAALGLPFWLAGSYGTPEGLGRAVGLGAAGVQVGTAFAYAAESGMAAHLKTAVIDRVRAGSLDVRSDWRVSPTGFPFRVVELEGTLSDPAVAAARKAVCDLGALRSPFRNAKGRIDYRCPAEPLPMYVRKGGREANAEGRRCLCNALMAAAGLPQVRPDGSVEPALVTSGTDFSAVADLAQDSSGYQAADVVDYLLRGVREVSLLG
jgi:NAD(P)H-dependent flavin oxidoreductase YrpB (nitropropane dioxygenase family)